MNRLALIAAMPLALSLSPASMTSAAAPKAQGAEATSTARVAKANRSAVREPRSTGFVNAAQVYAWTEGAIFRLYTAVEQISTISLQPGEQLVSVAAGDTARWVIGDTTSGAGAARRTHILIKPSQPGLKTNLVVATDRRIYLILATSGTGTAMTAMSWTYPQDELLALKAAAAAREGALPVASDVAVDRLNFNYTIAGDRPSWRPIRVFDDGVQAFIEFPLGFGSGEAPPLFVVGSKGKAELVNYRLRGRYYVVDRLFSQAELRLGEKKQVVVRLTRKAGR